MKIQQFFEHHGIAGNPFADEDAQTDLVFKGACIRTTYHPTWDKIYGEPSEPATAVVFGEKGSGKTALRLQVAYHLTEYNADHPDGQVFVVQYDDFNPFLDRFREKLSGRRRRADRALQRWRLWDHMDAMLSLAVTQLVDRLLEVKQTRYPAARDEPLPIDRLDPAQVRDVLLLAACYDQSTAENVIQRFKKLRRKLHFHNWFSRWDWVLGMVVTHAVIVWLITHDQLNLLFTLWPRLLITASWAPRFWYLFKYFWKARAIRRNTRVLNHTTNSIRRMLVKLRGSKLDGQPLPDRPRTDDRYELLGKLQGVLRSLGFDGIVVLIDRLDEPYLINGSTELMRALLWPLLDNKLLRHPGLGLKLLLPIELERLIDREDRDFHQRARLDKQNMVRSLQWTGQSLYDVANARVKACAVEGSSPALADLFDGSVDETRLMNSFGSLRVPRHLFKFMYRLLTVHCNAHSDEKPAWQISGETFESVLALYGRDQESLDRGESAG